MAEENSPELKRYKHFKEREEINMKYSKFQYLPDFSLNFGIEERGSLDRIWVASIGIDIPLYFWGKTAGVKEAQWRVSSAEYSLQNVKEVLFAEITSAYLSATASERLLNLYKGEIIPRASAALEASIVSYSVGKVDFLTVVTNLITLLDYQLTYYQKLIEFEKAVAKLEVLTGVQFATEVKSE
jgi:outer membrane protein TolC